MRNLILLLALASVAAPAMAQREDWSERRAADSQQRQQQRALAASGAEQPRERQMNTERRGWQRSEAVEAAQAADPQRGARGASNSGVDVQRGSVQRADDGQIARWRQRQEERRAGQVLEGSVPATRWSDRVRQAPASEGPTAPTTQVRTVPAVRYGRVLEGSVGSGRWQETQQSPRHWDGQRDGTRWSNHWRRDSRYDWQRYRDRNRAIFRVGRYYDPFGYGYRPLTVGIRLYSGYYQSNYWLDDPWQYRLPPVYGPYRWVRYYDDALLVDIWSGEVVDVIRNFFW